MTLESSSTTNLRNPEIEDVRVGAIYLAGAEDPEVVMVTETDVRYHGTYFWCDNGKAYLASELVPVGPPVSALTDVEEAIDKAQVEIEDAERQVEKHQSKLDDAEDCLSIAISRLKRLRREKLIIEASMKAVPA